MGNLSKRVPDNSKKPTWVLYLPYSIQKLKHKNVYLFIISMKVLETLSTFCCFWCPHLGNFFSLSIISACFSTESNSKSPNNEHRQARRLFLQITSLWLEQRGSRRVGSQSVTFELKLLGFVNKNYGYTGEHEKEL